MRPPDARVQAGGLLPHRGREVTDNEKAIILVQTIERVVSDAPCTERGVITLEQACLQPRAALGIPVHRHHVGQVRDAAPDAPRVPVDKPNTRGDTVAWIEHVPYMGVAVDERIRSIQTGWRVRWLVGCEGGVGDLYGTRYREGDRAGTERNTHDDVFRC